MSNLFWRGSDIMSQSNSESNISHLPFPASQKMKTTDAYVLITSNAVI